MSGCRSQRSERGRRPTWVRPEMDMLAMSCGNSFAPHHYATPRNASPRTNPRTNPRTTPNPPFLCMRDRTLTSIGKLFQPPHTLGLIGFPR